MSDVLSQAEIERLLQEMAGSGKAAPAPQSPRLEALGLLADRGAGSDPIAESDSRVILPLRRRRQSALRRRAGGLAFETYDFRRSDKLSKEQVRSLQVIHENFARLFTSSISGYLRATMQIDLVSIEQVPYDEYVRSISSSLINVLNVAELSGQAIFDIDLSILFVMIDRLLGGNGEGPVKSGHTLTDVEKVLARSIVRRALADLSSAWADVLSLEFMIASVETTAQFIQIVPGNDTIVLVLFDLGLNGHQGAMCVAIPFMLLKPYAHRLNAQHWFTSARKPSQHLAPKMAARLRELTHVPCVARLGACAGTLRTVMDLEVGQILPLQMPPGAVEAGSDAAAIASVELLIGDAPKFRGHIGLRGGKRLAVQIDSVMQPPPALEVHKDDVPL